MLEGVPRQTDQQQGQDTSDGKYLLVAISPFLSLIQDHLQELLQEHLSGHMEVALRDPLLYGDYTNALQSDQPRYYEDIQDFDTAKKLFDEVY